MLNKRFTGLFAFTAAALVLCAPMNPAKAQSMVDSKSSRTANRTVDATGATLPLHLRGVKRKKYSWSYQPTLDPIWEKYRHSQQWAGLYWDTKRWPEDMSEEQVLKAFYGADIFRRQYMVDKKYKAKAVLVVGPTFYKLSDLDRRRSLQLVADHFNFFDSGLSGFDVTDWRTGYKIGEYNAKGFQLF
ncbi:MAG: hypothetical protein EP349_06290 [Alphaproteobacteria bacterium]|nr:MAG: hypothetical protein EP349_06290 [Alphaproteobacteria bacterium]